MKTFHNLNHLEMNDYKTIDFKISICPTIVPRPNGVMLMAKISLPNKNVLLVKQDISRESLHRCGDAFADMVVEAFTRKISSEISTYIQLEAKQEIYNQL